MSIHAEPSFLLPMIPNPTVLTLSPPSAILNALVVLRRHGNNQINLQIHNSASLPTPKHRLYTEWNAQTHRINNPRLMEPRGPCKRQSAREPVLLLLGHDFHQCRDDLLADFVVKIHESNLPMHHVLEPAPHLLEYLSHVAPYYLGLPVVVTGVQDVAVGVAGPLRGYVGEIGAGGDNGGG